MSQATASAPPPAFDWKRWPETEAFIDEILASALAGNAFLANLAERMRVETSTRLVDWVDHLLITDRDGLDGHEHLPVLDRRIREVLVVRDTANPVYYGRLHARSFSLTALEN